MHIPDLRFLWHQRRQDRRRARKKLKKLAAAEVVVVSIAKSGRTWLNAMVSHYYHLKYGTPPDLLINGGNLKAIDSRVPSLFYTHGVELHGRNIDAVNRVPTLLAGKKTVFLYRDPRDVAVSRYFQMTHRKVAIGRSDRPIGIDADCPLDLDFMFHEKDGLPRIVRFMNAWARLIGDLSPVFRLEFERMSAETGRTLHETLAFIDGEADLDLVDRAVAFTAFGNLQALEKRGYFATGRFGGNPSDSDSLKVRRGKVGGYRDYFSAADLDVIDRFVAENLSSDFPYGKEALAVAAAVS